MAETAPPEDAVDPKMIIAAIPWLRRAWRMLPVPLRLPMFGVAAAVGIFLAVTGRDELLHAIREMRDGEAAAPRSTG